MAHRLQGSFQVSKARVGMRVKLSVSSPQRQQHRQAFQAILLLFILSAHCLHVAVAALPAFCGCKGLGFVYQDVCVGVSSGDFNSIPHKCNAMMSGSTLVPQPGPLDITKWCASSCWLQWNDRKKEGSFVDFQGNSVPNDAPWNNSSYLLFCCQASVDF